MKHIGQHATPTCTILIHACLQVRILNLVVFWLLHSHSYEAPAYQVLISEGNKSHIVVQPVMTGLLIAQGFGGLLLVVIQVGFFS
jgi:hypothetical protein